MITILILTCTLLCCLFFARKIKKSKSIFLLIGSLCFLELVSALAYRSKNGYLVYNKRPNPYANLFIPNDSITCTLKPNIDTIINGKNLYHNSLGWRNPPFSNKPYKIACIGGSTTYGVGISNSETWTHYLQQKLPDSVEVINLGIPGHTSVDHLYYAKKVLPIIQPQLILFHMGLNDMRMAYIDQLKQDYSNYHPGTLWHSVGLSGKEKLPQIALVHVVYDLCQQVGVLPQPPLVEKQKATNTDVSTEKLKKYYQKHLEALIDFSKKYTKQIIFVPQVLIPEGFYQQNYAWWAPFIPDEQLVPLMQEFNELTKSVAFINDCAFATPVENTKFQLSHFSDPSHLNTKGNALLVDSLFSFLKSNNSFLPKKQSKP